MASKQKARYVGPDGNVNHDVARDARRGSRMKNGEVYEVSEELFGGLMLSGDWEPESGSSDLADEFREKATKQSREASQGVQEGASYAELVASQEEGREAEDIKTPTEASNIGEPVTGSSGAEEASSAPPRRDGPPEPPPEETDEEEGGDAS